MWAGFPPRDCAEGRKEPDAERTSGQPFGGVDVRNTSLPVEADQADDVRAREVRSIKSAGAARGLMKVRDQVGKGTRWKHQNRG